MTLSSSLGILGSSGAAASSAFCFLRLDQRFRNRSMIAACTFCFVTFCLFGLCSACVFCFLLSRFASCHRVLLLAHFASLRHVSLLFVTFWFHFLSSHFGFACVWHAFCFLSLHFLDDCLFSLPILENVAFAFAL
jgi:hypothetical protein